MSTVLYGASDDLIEIEGDLREEFDSYDTISLLAFNDGTICTICYDHGGIWRINVLRRGDLFDNLKPCVTDGTGDDYSDRLYFLDAPYADGEPLKVWAGSVNV